MEKINEGIEVVKFATMHDAKNRLDEAVYLYELAVSLLDAGLGSITDSRTQQVVSQKRNEYNARLETLKCQQLDKILNPQQMKTQEPEPKFDLMSIPEVIAALKLADQAVTEERRGNVASSIDLYVRVYKSLLQICQRPDIPADSKAFLESKATDYMVHAQKLQGHEERKQDAAARGDKYVSPVPFNASIPFGLKPGQTQYVDPLYKPSFTERLANKFK